MNVDENKIVCYNYDAWGNYSIEGNEELGELNPYRYRGYYYDTETGLYYLQTRYYDPEVGRFISQDDVSYLDPEHINGLNLYAYCLNNPVMNIDPNGHFVLLLFIAAIVAGAIAGAILGGVYGAATAAANGQDIGWGILIGAVSGLFLGAVAGAAGYFMAPLLVGASAVAGLSAGASFAVGLSIAAVGGFGVGFATDLATQAANGKDLDFKSAAISGAQASFFTVIGAMFGSLGTGFAESFGVSLGSGILTSAFNMLIEVIKIYFSKKESSSIKLKVAYGI